MPGALGVDTFFKNQDLVRSLTAGWRFRELTTAATEVTFVAPAAAPGDVRMSDPIYKFTSPATQRTRILNGTIPRMKLKTSATAEIEGTAKIVFAKSGPSKTLVLDEVFTIPYSAWTFVALGDQSNDQLNSGLHINFDDGRQTLDLLPNEILYIYLTNTVSLISPTNSTLTIGMYFQDQV